MFQTYNFRQENYDYSYPVQAAGSFRESRNGVICTNPSLDLECYINYLDLLDNHKDIWKNNGYLHLGMMPVVMAPSFMQRKFTELICAKLNELGARYYSMPPISLFYEVCKLDEPDIWMFREDAAKLIGRTNVTAVDFLREVFK